MPKTAGVSFRATLEEHFGEGFRHDYADYPLNQTPELRNASALLAKRSIDPLEYSSALCVHGHLLPMKYLGLAQHRDCKFVTWLREPLARLVSHYHYWHFTYDKASPTTAALHRRVVEESWTLKQFCLSDELRNVYSQFLSGFPVTALDFIGITEFYDDDLRYFSEQYLCEKVTPRALNIRPQPEGKLTEDSLSAMSWDEVTAFHANDIALYQMALARRKERNGDK